MKILVDENTPRVTVEALREKGHDVLDIRGTSDQGIEDSALWKMAQEQKRLLISTDKGFATHRHEVHCGILIVRLKQPNRRRIHERVLEGFSLVSHADWDSLLISMRDNLHSIWRARSE